MPRPTDTITRLVQRLSEGDVGTRSFDADADRVLRLLEPVARRTCRACVPAATDEHVEDLVQDTLLIAWRRLVEFEPASAPERNRQELERWVKQIARFTCANAQRRRRETLMEDGVVDVADPAMGPLAWLGAHERDELVREVIDGALSGLDQDVVYHRHLHGLERAEIARLLGLADADSVRVRLQAAHRKLKTALVAKLAEIGAGLSLWHEDFVA